MTYRVLAINPGSTSTKIAVYDDETPVLIRSLRHSPEELARFASVPDQFDWRKNLVEAALEQAGIELKSVDVVIGRGGLIKRYL